MYYVRLFLIIISAYLYIKIISNTETESIFDIVAFYFLLIIFGISLLTAIYIDIKKYKIQKLKKHLVSSALGGIFVLAFICTHIYVRNLDSSPILFRASKKIDLGGMFFDFREDGTYKYTNWFFISATFHRGTYVQKDSIIYLLDWQDIPSTKEIKGIIKTNTLIIRGDLNQLDSCRLFQIDPNHNQLPTVESFRIINLQYSDESH